MKMPIVVRILGTVPKGLEKNLGEMEIRGRTDTKQTAALLKPVEYLEESWRREETCCHSGFSEKPPIRAGVKSSQGLK